jgi:hypothetical protein
MIDASITTYDYNVSLQIFMTIIGRKRKTVSAREYYYYKLR